MDAEENTRHPRSTSSCGTPPTPTRRACRSSTEPELPISPRLVSNDIHMFRTIAAVAPVLAFVPDGMLPDPDPAMDTLVPVLPELIGRRRTLWFVVPDVRRGDPRVATMVDTFRAFAQSTVDGLDPR